MGIDDAIARAKEAEAQDLNKRREQQAFEVKVNQVVNELYRDFVKRVQRAGVEPQKVIMTRPRPYFARWLNGEAVVDTGRKAWVVYWTELSEQLSSNPWVAVTEDGTRILVHVETRKGHTVLRTWDSPPNETLLAPRVRHASVDAEEFEKEELKRIDDKMAEILAAALRRLGAV